VPQFLTPEQVKHRQTKAAVLGYTTAGMGVAALGLRGGAGAIRQGAKLGKLANQGRASARLKPLAGLKQYKKAGKRAERASNTIGTTAAGVGALAGLNSARLAWDNSKRHKEPVMKNETPGLDFGLSGIHQGQRITVWGDEIGKAYDPERNRRKRLSTYHEGALIGGGALGAGALHQGYQAVKSTRLTRGPKAGPASKGAITGLRLSRKMLGQTGRSVAFGLGAAGALKGANKVQDYRRQTRTYVSRSGGSHPAISVT
jgi:hypothetical protein